MQRRNPGQHVNISEDLAWTIREMIVDGRLAAGQRINEVHLAERLGVSRTPLREALASLLLERGVVHRPRRGFYVRELTVAEVEGLYPIRALLDPEALRLSGIPSAKRIAQLANIADQIATARQTKRAIALDDDWHRKLWASCPNPVLCELIEQFMRRTRRYELALMSERRNLEKTAHSKREILAALERGHLERACALLHDSLHRAQQPIVEWLTAREHADV